MVSVPRVSAAIAYVYARTIEVEVVAMRIASVYSKAPIATAEVERAVEVSCITEGAILPVEQHVAHVEVAVAPVGAIKVVHCVDTHQIVEVYLISSLILVVGEVKLISHLVGEEQSLLASLLVAHCVCRERKREQQSHY